MTSPLQQHETLSLAQAITDLLVVLHLPVLSALHGDGVAMTEVVSTLSGVLGISQAAVAQIFAGVAAYGPLSPYSEFTQTLSDSVRWASRLTGPALHGDALAFMEAKAVVAQVPGATYSVIVGAVHAVGAWLNVQYPVILASAAFRGDGFAQAEASSQALAVPKAAALGAYSWYMDTLFTNPLEVDCATAAILYVLGKRTSTAINGKQGPDTGRDLGNWAVLGILDGICTHEWYAYMQRVADGVQTDQITDAFAMTLTSGLLFTPAYGAGFLALLSLLEGRGVGGAVDRVRLDLPDLFWRSTKVWTPTNFILFGFVPIRIRTICSMGVHYLFLVSVALWNVAVCDSRDVDAVAEQPELGAVTTTLIRDCAVLDSEPRQEVDINLGRRRGSGSRWNSVQNAFVVVSRQEPEKASLSLLFFLILISVRTGRGNRV